MYLIQKKGSELYLITKGEDKYDWTPWPLEATEWISPEWAEKARARCKLQDDAFVILYSTFFTLVLSNQ